MEFRKQAYGLTMSSRIFSPAVQLARWDHMHRFLSVVCLSVVWT